MVNVTENLLRRYIELFNTTFLDTARAFLPKQIPEMLFHYSLIQGGVSDTYLLNSVLALNI